MQKQKRKQTRARRNPRAPRIRNMDSTNRSCSDFIFAPVDVTTTVQASNVLVPLLGAGGVFETFPQVMKPFMAGLTSTFDFRGRIKIDRLDLKLSLVSSVDNGLVAADLFDNIRYVLAYVDTPFQGVPTLNQFTIVSPLDRRDLRTIFVDTLVPLPQRAVLAAAPILTLPQVEAVDLSFKDNRVLECFSKANGVAWDTRHGSYYLFLVSDSAILPNPRCAGSVRVWFTILDH